MSESLSGVLVKDRIDETPGHSLAEGLAAHRSGDHSGAARIYEAILHHDPEHADALHLTGVLALQRGDLESARYFINRALQGRSNDAAFHSNMAIVLHRLGTLNKALDHAQKAASLNAKSAQIQRVLGQCFAELAQPEQALVAYARANSLSIAHRPSIDAELDCLMTLGRHADVLARIRTSGLEPDDSLRFREAQALRALGRPEEALVSLKTCREPHGLLWQLNMLKHYLECGDEVSAVLHGQAVLELKEQLAMKRYGSVISDSPEPVRDFRPNDHANPRRNLVCFSLWGAQPKYTLNAIRNAEQVPLLYPGWLARFYVDESVPQDIRVRLRAEGASVIEIDASEDRHVLRSFWRFFASDEPGVERFVCRDCDALVNPREAAAVRAWIESGHPFHVMRDHAEHAELMMAGMWGGVAGRLPNLQAEALAYFRQYTPRWRWMDQDFLRDRVWPLIRRHCLVHDDRYRMGADRRPFPPVVLPPGSHVGGYSAAA